MEITHYMVLASIRDSQAPENDITKTYCKTAIGFVTDAEVVDSALTEGEADSIYASAQADAAPYSIVSKIAVYDSGKTEVITEKTL